MPSTGLARALRPVTLLALALTWSGPAAAAEPPRRDPSKLTMKERLSGKASDPQRVNDCKVPLERRGDRPRPADCAKR